jgi:hypothetical protein
MREAMNAPAMPAQEAGKASARAEAAPTSPSRADVRKKRAERSAAQDGMRSPPATRARSAYSGLFPIALCLSFSLAACQPDLGAPASLVSSPRVLAVRGTPPEASAGSMVHFDVLLASPEGTVASPAANWSFCLSPKPPADNNGVGAACLRDDTQASIGGPIAETDATLPKDACQLFGPEVPSAKPGQPPARPADPDVTGGYYQPVRVKIAEADIDGAAAFGLERISCNLANAPVDVVQSFGKDYKPNTNPALTQVTAIVGSAAPVTVLVAPETTSPVSVKAGAAVSFSASWTEASAETFPVYDPATLTLVSHREALRLSWFATEGQFLHERTGAEEKDTATSTENTWTAPSKAGVVHVWVVLRDSRGGTDFGGFEVTVTP